MTVVLLSEYGRDVWEIPDMCDPDAHTEVVGQSLPDNVHIFTPRYGKEYVTALEEEDDRLATQALVDIFESRDPEFRGRAAAMSRIVGEKAAELVYGLPAYEAAVLLAEFRERIAATWPELYKAGTLQRDLDVIEADVLHALIVSAVADSDELRAAARQFVAAGGTIPRRKRNRSKPKGRSRNRNRSRNGNSNGTGTGNGNGTSPQAGGSVETGPDKQSGKGSGNSRNRNRNRSRNGKPGANTGNGKPAGNSRNRNRTRNRNRNRNGSGAGPVKESSNRNA